MRFVMIAQVGLKSREVDSQKNAQRIAESLFEERQKHMTMCQDDLSLALSMAKPILATATKAIKNIDKADLSRIKALTSPPASVESVLAAVLLLSSPAGNLATDVSWTRAKRALSSIDRFLIELLQVCEPTLSLLHLCLNVFRCLHASMAMRSCIMLSVQCWRMFPACLLLEVDAPHDLIPPVPCF